MRALEELALVQAGQKAGDRRFHCVHLGLAGPRRIEFGPVDRRQRTGVHPFLAHPRDQLFVGAPAGGATVQDEVDVAVPAGPEDAVLGARHRTPGHEGTGARRCRAGNVDERRRMSQRRDHRGLGRHVDQLAMAAARSRGQRHRCAHRRLGPSPGVGLRRAHAHRFAARLAGERHGAGGSHDFDIGRAPLRLRPGQPEWRDRHQDQARIEARQPIEVEQLFIANAGLRRGNQHVGADHQSVEARHPARALQIESHQPLVDIERLPVAGRQVRIGLLDLRDGGSHVGEHAPRQPAKAPGAIYYGKARQHEWSERPVSGRYGPATAPSRTSATSSWRCPWR